MLKIVQMAKEILLMLKNDFGILMKINEKMFEEIYVLNSAINQ